MTCQEIFAQLSEYLDVALPPETCREIEEHIAGCPPCVAFVRSLERTVELCRAYRPGEMPAPLAEDARQQLRQAFAQLGRSGEGA
jgi:RNA polymerase sigma-70 factor (ECF subfamily)